MCCALSRHPMFDQSQSHRPVYDNPAKEIQLVHHYPDDTAELNLQSIMKTTNIDKICENFPGDTCADQVNTCSFVST